MNQIRRAIEVTFVLALAALILGGVLFVAAQAAALAAGQGDWLGFFNESVKPALGIAASVCAFTGFLLSYKPRRQREPEPQKAMTR